jgi:hypothetical protein
MYTEPQGQQMPRKVARAPTHADFDAGVELRGRSLGQVPNSWKVAASCDEREEVNSPRACQSL